MASKISIERTRALVSSLKPWKITVMPNRAKLGIECPNCGGKALVSKQWNEPRTYKCFDGSTVLIVGRACTYCFKAARIPN